MLYVHKSIKNTLQLTKSYTKRYLQFSFKERNKIRKSLNNFCTNIMLDILILIKTQEFQDLISSILLCKNKRFNLFTRFAVRFLLHASGSVCVSKSISGVEVTAQKRLHLPSATLSQAALRICLFLIMNTGPKL